MIKLNQMIFKKSNRWLNLETEENRAEKERRLKAKAAFFAKRPYAVDWPPKKIEEKKIIPFWNSSTHLKEEVLDYIAVDPSVLAVR